MADDIVTRLRDEAFLVFCGHADRARTSNLMREAADEIKRLQSPTGTHRRVLMWCTAHNEPAWRYPDGSEACWYDSIVETNNHHTLTELPYEVTHAN